MNWTFIFQLLAVILAWLLATRVYKHFAWFDKRNLEFNIPNFPRLSSFLEKHLNKEGVLFYVITILLVIPIYLCGCFGAIALVLIVGRGILHEFGHVLETKTPLIQTLIWMGLIFFYYGARIWWDKEKVKSFLSSKREIDGYKTNYIRQNISEIATYKIPTYPRFTMFDIGNKNDSERKLIFDSSDFTIINETFGVNEDYPCISILQEKEIELYEVKYTVETVRADLLNVFDDYASSPFGRRHTSVYKGKDVPYNIQIIIEARKSEMQEQ